MVRAAVEEVVHGANPAALVRDRHRDWCRLLFGPSVELGLLAAGDLEGYRRRPVYLSGSRHVPMRWEAVPEAMETLFELLGEEAEPSVRAVLGHFCFAYIHPYPDGNGRLARFIMNIMLASGGYSWTKGAGRGQAYMVTPTAGVPTTDVAETPDHPRPSDLTKRKTPAKLGSDPPGRGGHRCIRALVVS